MVQFEWRPCVVCQCVCAGGSCREGGVGNGGSVCVWGGGLCGPADAPGARGARDEEVKKLLLFSAAAVALEKQRQALHRPSFLTHQPTD